MNHKTAFLFSFLMLFPMVSAHSKQVVPPYTEAVLPKGDVLYALAIGPGGPGIEFGSNETNGGLYRISVDGKSEQVHLSDGKGLKNPTGFVDVAGHFIIVDGNEVISIKPDGTVNWRQSNIAEGVFFYDIEMLDENTLLVSDFGRGGFVEVDANNGKMKPYMSDINIKGLARFEMDRNKIYAVSWGADDAWDSSLYRVEPEAPDNKINMIATGFGNLESVKVIDQKIVVGGYRGHKLFPDTKLMLVGDRGSISPIEHGSDYKGVSDIYTDGQSVWLSYFYDAVIDVLKVDALFRKDQK